MTVAEPKPYKRHVDAVKVAFPYADDDLLERGDEAGTTYWVVMEDCEESDAVIADGLTRREAWAAAAAKVKATR